MSAYESIALWGDSIGKGIIYDEARGRYAIIKENCINLISQALNRPIANHARMGQTAAQALAMLREDQCVPGGLAILEFGGNDCDMPWKEISEAPAEEHLPRQTLADFRASLTALVERVRGTGMTPLLVTPPPLDAERYFAWVSRGLNAEAILRWLGDVEHIYRWQERYSAAVRDVAARTNSLLFDLRDLFLSERTVAPYLCVDGIHPNKEGHRIIAAGAIQAFA